MKTSAIFVSLVAAAAAQISTTANDVESGKCAAITLIFARGSTEIGNMGAIVGPSLAQQLQQAADGAKNVAVQGVTYPADIAGAVTGATNPKGAQGAQTMAQLAQTVAQKCPESKVVLSGYSQGAEQVRGALMNLGAKNNVAAAVTFGDPLKSQAFQNIDKTNTLVNCASGDGVCSGTFAISAAHLSYGSNGDIAKSVQFIMGIVGNAKNSELTGGGSSTSTPTKTKTAATTSSKTTGGGGFGGFSLPTGFGGGFSLPTGLGGGFSLPTGLGGGFSWPTGGIGFGGFTIPSIPGFTGLPFKA